MQGSFAHFHLYKDPGANAEGNGYKCFYEIVDSFGSASPFNFTWRADGKVYRNVISFAIKGVYVPNVQGQVCLYLNLPAFDKRWPVPTNLSTPARFRDGDQYSNKTYACNPPLPYFKELDVQLLNPNGAIVNVSNVSGEELRVSLILEIICKDVQYES